MPGIGACVRPYPGRLGKQVIQFVEAQGFKIAPGLVLPSGTTDVRAARWIHRTPMDLLVLPFHVHRGSAGEVLDAVGVLFELDDEIDLEKLSIFMPVRAFSWGASFQRRIDALTQARPLLAGSLLIAHQDELETATLGARLRRMVESNRSAARAWRFSATAETPRDSGGASSAFGLSLMPVRGGVPPSSRRPSGFPPSAPWLNGAEKSPPSANSSSDELVPSGERFWESHQVMPRSGVRGLGAEEVNGPASARESFRRAAEIGAQARRELEEEFDQKKTQEF